jgi:O-antigen/teichoic acid export membrane protein
MRIAFSDTKRQILQNVFWAITGKVVKLFSEVLVGIFVARYLGPEQYGLMNYVISYVAVFSVLASFGLDNIEIREIAKDRQRKEKYIGTAWCVRLFLAVVTMILILVSVFVAEADFQARGLILIYSTSAVFSSCNVFRNFFTAIVQNRQVVVAEIIRCIIGASIKVALLLIHASLVWFVVALSFDFLLLAGGYLTSYFKYNHKIPYRFDKPTAKFMLWESFPLFLSGIAIVVYQKIDQILINKMLDNSALGNFSVAQKLAELVYFLPMILAQTMSPILVRIKKENYEHYLIKRQQFVTIVVWMSVIMSVIVCVAALPIVKYSFGPGYLAAVLLLQVGIWKTVGMALSDTSGQLIIIDGIQRWALVRNVAGCVVCVVGNLLFIPRWGTYGAMWVSVCTVLCSGFFCNLLIPAYRPLFWIQCKALCLKNIAGK